MSEETVGFAGQPKGLLQQMEELMAALNADLSALERPRATEGAGCDGRVEEGDVG
ncbi:hypothetical protein [Streptomyces sp. NPDC014995]|uniref:hypothetical protein n=1 Tax=Streptomyces sp. NPDC014995 TaxID=3364936 RepID=UPI0036FDE438